MENLRLEPCRFLELFGPNLVEKMDRLYEGAQASSRITSSASGALSSFGDTNVFDQRTIVGLSSRHVTNVDVTGTEEAERAKANGKKEEAERQAKREQDQRNFLIGLSAAAAAIWAAWRAGSYIQKSNFAFTQANEADILLRARPPYGIDFTDGANQQATEACGKVFQQFRDFYIQKSWSTKVSGGFALAIAAEATAVAISALYKCFSVRNVGIVAIGLTALGAIFTYAVSPKAQLSSTLLHEISAIKDAVKNSQGGYHFAPAPPSYDTVRQNDYNAQLAQAGFEFVSTGEGGLEWTYNKSNNQMFWRFPGSQQWNFAGYVPKY